MVFVQRPDVRATNARSVCQKITEPTSARMEPPSSPVPSSRRGGEKVGAKARPETGRDLPPDGRRAERPLVVPFRGTEGGACASAATLLHGRTEIQTSLQKEAGGDASNMATPRNPLFLRLFSGPSGRKDGLAAALRQLGSNCEDWDIVNGDLCVLADDATYRKLRRRIVNGVFDGGLLGPPCHTFSNARKEDDGGPRPIRRPGDRGIYGRSDLTPDEKEDVRLGTLLALRALDVLRCLREQDKPVILEQPARVDDEEAISMLFKQLLALDGVHHTRLSNAAMGRLRRSRLHWFTLKGDVQRCYRASTLSIGGDFPAPVRGGLRRIHR